MLYLRSRSDKRPRELMVSFNSLRHLCVLGVSAMSDSWGCFTAEAAKATQRKHSNYEIPRFHSNSARTGAWSEGRSQARVALSISAALDLVTKGSDTQT